MCCADTLVKGILEERIKGKKQSERHRCRILDLMKKKRQWHTYQSLKEMAECRSLYMEKLVHWCLEPAVGQIAEN